MTRITGTMWGSRGAAAEYASRQTLYDAYARLGEPKIARNDPPDLGLGKVARADRSLATLHSKLFSLKGFLHFRLIDLPFFRATIAGEDLSSSTPATGG